MKQYEIAEELLNAGASVDIEGTDKNKISPPGYCVAYNDLKCVVLLLQFGANVDRKSTRVIGAKNTLYMRQD
jgi:hypothetical protein